jgi:hypothetical protein
LKDGKHLTSHPSCTYIQIWIWDLLFITNVFPFKYSFLFHLTIRPCKITSRHITRMNISNKLYNIENSFILHFSIIWQLQYLDIFLKHLSIVQLVHNVIVNQEFYQYVDILFVSWNSIFVFNIKKEFYKYNQVQLVLKMNGIIKNLH